jgi:amino acid transporter
VDLLGQFLSVDPSAPIAWFVVGSIAAVVAAGILIYLLSTRGIARVAAILAAVGMLVYFYLAAVVTLIAAGHKPHYYSISMPATPLVNYGPADVLLAVLVVVGFEVVTTVNRDVRSVGRSMGLAFALTAGIAVMVAAAVSPRLFRSIPMPSDEPFPSLVGAYLGNAGAWLLIGNLAFGCAALLMLTFGAVRVAQRLAEQFDLPVQEGTRLTGVVGIVGVLVIVEWLWAGFAASKLVDVGPLLLLAVYACAAHACARIQSAQPRIAAEAARLFVWGVGRRDCRDRVGAVAQ